MEIATFLAHFLFVGLTFVGGIVVGWQTYEKAKPLMLKLKLKRSSNQQD